MSNSIKLNDYQLNQVVNYYKEYAEPTDNDSILFRAKSKDFSIIIYKNLTCLFQGKNAQEELNKWKANEVIQIDLFKDEIELEVNSNQDHIGSDEVGCGDYFGPVVVAASFVKEIDIQYLKDIGIKDSKQLTDTDIIKLAPLIKEKVKTITFVLSNKKYNELQEKGNYNLNKIKAYLHNFVLSKISKETSFDKLIVVDQFCSEELYYKYLLDYKSNDILRNIHFETKAENKYLAVACASIVARETFLKEIDKMNEELGYKIILGASSKVDELAKKILDEKGMDYLKQFVKYHFKNTQKILEM